MQQVVGTLWSYLRQLRSWLAEHLGKYAVWSRFTSSLYYALLSSRFGREHQAVLCGQIKHLDESDSLAGVRFQLRRGVHRLEKGILMRPRRDLFALDYIERTVQCYEKVLHSNGYVSSGEVGWARDVLDRYFSIVGEDPAVERARARYEKCDRQNVGQSDGLVSESPAVTRGADVMREARPIQEGTLRIPYRREVNCSPPVSYKDFWKLSRQRRSVRWFAQKSIPRNLIDKAVAVAAQSPSACNRLPYEFRIFDDSDMISKVAGLPMGTTGFKYNFPAVAVVVGRLRAYYHERDRHLIYIDGALAAMSFMYALETLSLSSCPINWPDLEVQEQKMADLLDLDPDERPIMLIAFGYPDPDGKVAYSHKKDVDELRTYN